MTTWNRNALIFEVRLKLASSEGSWWRELSEMLYTDVLELYSVSGGCGYWYYIVKHREWPPLENLIVPELEDRGGLQSGLSLEGCL